MIPIPSPVIVDDDKPGVLVGKARDLLIVEFAPDVMPQICGQNALMMVDADTVREAKYKCTNFVTKQEASFEYDRDYPNKAWVDGWNAAYHFILIEHNPYPADDWRHAEFIRGYEAYMND
jgi:hypothetical protein